MFNHNLNSNAMKKVHISILLTLLSLTFLGTQNSAMAQIIPDTISKDNFLITITNDRQTSNNVYKFDIYAKDMDSVEVFEMAGFQFGAKVNSGIYNGGVVTATVEQNSSPQLTNSAQYPVSVSFKQEDDLIQIAATPTVWLGNGSILETSGNGTYLCTVVLTNTLPFTSNSLVNLQLFGCNITGATNYPSKISMYFDPLAKVLPVVVDTSLVFTGSNIVLSPEVPQKILHFVSFLVGVYEGNGTMSKAQGDSGDQYPGNIADLVSLELHNGLTGVLEYSRNDLAISTSGMITDTIPYSYSGSYYIFIKHRNSITTSSFSPVSFDGTVITYNFTTHVSQAYGLNMKDVDGVAIIYGGDENQDGLVDSSDMIDVDNAASAFATGYILTDVNGDGLVDSSDMILVDNNASMFIGAMLP